MAITSYSELQTAVGNWLNKSGDANLTARIPEFIALAEARFRRKLDDEVQHTTATVTFTSGVAPLPADFQRLVSIDTSDFTDNSVIEFDIAGDNIRMANGLTLSGTADIIYKQALPALSNTTTTNWLLSRAPDAYLFGALIQAEFFGWNDERLPLIKSALDEIIGELQIDSEVRRWGPAPLGPQINRT